MTDSPGIEIRAWPVLETSPVVVVVHPDERIADDPEAIKEIVAEEVRFRIELSPEDLAALALARELTDQKIHPEDSVSLAVRQEIAAIFKLDLDD